MKAFQQYQAEFVGHLRDPRHNARPKGASARRMRVYAEIVFNNMDSTLSACFPVCRKVLGVRRWQQLVRAFLAGHRCSTPLFRQIPEEFLRWLEQAPVEGLPPYLRYLAHYEWVELALAVAEVRDAAAVPDGDLLSGRPVLAASLALLEYPYPVQRITPRFRPRQPDPVSTHLLVFRDAAEQVRFIEINAVTARLLQLLREEAGSGREALQRIARELGQDDVAAILAFGAPLLEELRRQGAILGTAV